jgi:hypothetical protein
LLKALLITAEAARRELSDVANLDAVGRAAKVGSPQGVGIKPETRMASLYNTMPGG